MKKFEKNLRLQNYFFKLLKNKIRFCFYFLTRKSIKGDEMYFFRNYFKKVDLGVTKINTEFLKILGFVNLELQSFNYLKSNNFFLMNFENFNEFLKVFGVIDKFKNQVFPLFFELNGQIISLNILLEFKKHFVGKKNLFVPFFFPFFLIKLILLRFLYFSFFVSINFHYVYYFIFL